MTQLSSTTRSEGSATEPHIASATFECISTAPPATTATDTQPGESRPSDLLSLTLEVVDQLLRDRETLLMRIDRGEELMVLARAMIVTIVICTAIFGASMGLYRGGIQMLFAAVKMPLVVLMTAALVAPVLTALRAAFEGSACVRRELALVLSTLALGSLCVVALTPLMLLASRFGLNYHASILLTAGCAGLAGLVSMGLFIRGVWRRTGEGRWLILAVVPMVFMMVGVQMTWTLRPYLVRPKTVEVPFVRSIEGGFFDSVSRSALSMVGIYPEAFETRRGYGHSADSSTPAPPPLDQTRAAPTFEVGTQRWSDTEPLGGDNEHR